MNSFITGRIGHGTRRQTSDATAPGCTAYDVTRVPSNRRASSCVNRTFASFDTLYSGRPVGLSVGFRTASQSMPLAWKCIMLETFTMRAGALCFSRSSSSLVSRKWPTWLVPKASSNPLLVRPV